MLITKYVCDVCGEDIPADPPILLTQKLVTRKGVPRIQVEISRTTGTTSVCGEGCYIRFMANVLEQAPRTTPEPTTEPAPEAVTSEEPALAKAS